MTRTTLRLPAPLRAYAGGGATIELRGSNLGDALDALRTEHGALFERICDERGEPRPFVRFFIGQEDASGLGGRAAPLGEGSVVSVLPAVAGGSP